MNKSRKALLVGGAAVVSLIIASPVLADEAATGATTSPQAAWQDFGHKLMGGAPEGPPVMGTVTAISGSTITLTGKDGGTYTIDASAAKVVTGTSTPATLGDVKVGDTLMVGGKTVTASVTASEIHDGLPPQGQKPSMGPGPRMSMGRNAAFGTVASVSGSTFTLVRKGPDGNTTVTVTTSGSTTYKKNGQADTLADITTGKTVVVMGTKDASGNVAATSVNVMVPRTAPATTQS